MFASVMKAVSILALAAHAFAAEPLSLMDIPKAGISQCGQITFAWGGGTTPYSLFLRSNATGPVIKVFPIMLNQAYDWKVDLPAGTEFAVQLQSGADENGAIQALTSELYTIIDSSDRSCINTAIFEYPSPSPTYALPPKPSLTMVPAFPSAASHSANHTIPIVLGVLAGLVVLLLVALGLLIRARRKARVDPEMLADNVSVADDDIKKPLPTDTKK